MILEFGANNFTSFKEGFEISFQKNKTSIKKEDIANIVALKGANASGKTNVLKALSAIKDFAINSFFNKPDEEIYISSFFHNDKPINLYIVFLDANGNKYKYEVEFTKDKIISEKIYKTVKRETLVIHRKNNTLVHATNDYKQLNNMPINRKNASIISIAKQYGIKEIDDIYNLFSIVSNVNFFGKIDNKETFLDYTAVSKIYKDDKYFLKFAIDFLKKSDTGIENIEIKETKDEQSGEITYFPIFFYKTTNSISPLLYYEQSAGTRALYTQLHLYASILKFGGILALDEFDIHLHPDLLPLIFELFEDKTKNKNGAQLILTTHNYDIMDRLGKYKTILVNKEENESFLYRLDEIPGDILRQDRKISPAYNSHKIGGKPKIK